MNSDVQAWLHVHMMNGFLTDDNLHSFLINFKYISPLWTHLYQLIFRSYLASTAHSNDKNRDKNVARMTLDFRFDIYIGCFDWINQMKYKRGSLHHTTLRIKYLASFTDVQWFSK